MVVFSIFIASQNLGLVLTNSLIPLVKKSMLVSNNLLISVENLVSFVQNEQVKDCFSTNSRQNVS